MFIDQWTKIAPKHWTRKKLKHVASLRSGESITADSIKDEGDFPVYGGNGLRGYTSDYTHDGEFVLIGRQGALCGNVNYARDRFWASEHAVVVTRLGDDDLTWLGELLRYLDLNRLSQSAAQPGISAEEVSNVLLAVPPLEEQRAISAYLKSETTRLDALVTAKQRVLDVLAEKRKAIIATAVTRGLDPKVKLRDSGAPWLGEIPAHWPLVPLRYLLKLGPKNGISPQQAGSDGVLSFSISAVRDGRVTIEGNEKFVDLERSVARGYYLQSGDILLVRGNGNLSLVGTCGLLEMAPDECTYPDILMLMRVGERIIAELLVAAINAPYVRQQIESLAQTTNGTYKLSGEDVRTLQIALPPQEEQRAIVAHIARETAKLDAVRAATERTIALLKERRSALIAAAVTGQLDVGAAA